VEFILDCAQKGKFEEDELINEFNTYGIKLVIQDDLPGSKIRGAFKVNKNIPSIYLTRKYKRIADIYYALLHELAHCKSDFNKAKSTNLVSYDNEKCEDRADAQALNWMVNNEYYESIVLKKINNYDAKMEYPMCFILYRLALDKYIDYSDAQYQKYNFIIKSLQK